MLESLAFFAFCGAAWLLPVQKRIVAVFIQQEL
jgi:hypothetical protein